MVKCPNCGAEGIEGKFCPKCGTKIPEEESANETIQNNLNENNNDNQKSTQQENHSNVPQKNTKYCKNCGELIDANAEICPKCGVRVENPVSNKSPVLAAVLSFFIPGVGQIYDGLVKRGILFIILGIIFVILYAIVIGAFLYLILWIYGMYDAYNCAKKINEGIEIEDKFF